MSELSKYQVGGLLHTDQHAPRGVQRRTKRRAAELVAAGQIETLKLGIEQHLNHYRVAVVKRATEEAIDAQLDITSRARIAVEIEPGAIGDVSYLSQKGTLGLGAVIDATAWRVTQ